ncbi:MAG: twin-arginine translocase TatA/TatE family subunit [Kiritimatiellae bacterium]|nr:twin-arginine translocase TatA/TatE family subunit [Kiritimatiellia bacterium]
MQEMAFISPSNVGPWQVLVIVLLIVFLFGGKKIPEISRALGRSLSEFKKGREEGERELSKSDNSGEETGAPEKKS